MRQIRVSGFVRSDLPAEISMSHVGSNPMFQTFCQQSSATVTAKKGGKLTLAAVAASLWEDRANGPWSQKTLMDPSIRKFHLLSLRASYSASLPLMSSSSRLQTH